MARLRTALLVAIFAVATPRAARSDASGQDTGVAFEPNVRVSSVVHVSGMPDALKLCAPVGRQCPTLRSLSAFEHGTVVTSGYQIGINGIAMGPFRIGIEGDLAWGKGPSTRLGRNEALSGSWLHSGGAFVLGVQLRFGDVRTWFELLPGFMNIEGDIQGRDRSGTNLSALGSTYFLGARAGVGVAVRPWLDLGAFAGAEVGSFTDGTGGLRLDFHGFRARL